MAMSVDDRELIIEMSGRHHVSESAVRACLEALRRGGGTMAQFSHPDFGGMAQWIRGGMTMVGDMFNDEMKQRLDALASDLSKRLLEEGKPEGTSAYATSHSSEYPGPGWWPADLGSPATAGHQNDMRYAVFPIKQRLAIEDGGVLSIYDTGDHVISGASQQQGGGVGGLRFASQHGPVRIQDFTKLA
jgi:hypothetical protein